MSNTEKDSGLEFLESPEGLAGEIGKVEKVIGQNGKILTYAGAGILAILLCYFGYKWYVSNQDEQAQAALFGPVFSFEADSLNKALKGTAGNAGLLAVADEYGATPSGNLAHFYAGVALMKQGKFDDAIAQLKDFSSSDLLVQGRAYCLLGDAYLEKNDAEEAVNFYKKAAGYNPNPHFTPSYMMKLAIAQEKAKKNSDAIETYGEIVAKYPQSAESMSAKKYKALLESAAE